MESLKKLYEILLKLEKAAEGGDRLRVIEINQKEFSPEYNRIFGAKAYNPGTLEEFYDKARNNCTYAVLDLGDRKYEEKYRKGCIQEVKKLLAKIPKPGA